MAKRVSATTAHAKVAAPLAPTGMWDATAKPTGLRVKVKANAVTLDKARVKVVLKPARVGHKVRAARVRAVIVRPVKTVVLAESSKTMISNPARMRTWAPKAVSMRLAINRMAAMAHANPTRPAPAST